MKMMQTCLTQQGYTDTVSDHNDYDDIGDDGNDHDDDDDEDDDDFFNLARVHHCLATAA